jgi:putative transposase
MTDDRMALIELIEKRVDGDLVRELLALAAERIMELDVEAETGVPAGVRSPDRRTHRNGYQERAWDTRVGRIELAIPKLRKGSYFPSFLEPRRTAEKTLTAVIQEGVGAWIYQISKEIRHLAYMEISGYSLYFQRLSISMNQRRSVP